MKSTWLHKDNGEPTIAFQKVYKKERLLVDGEVVVVRNDKNYQVVSVENHPELNYLKGRPFILCIQDIVEACRKEENHE